MMTFLCPERPSVIQRCCASLVDWSWSSVHTQLSTGRAPCSTAQADLGVAMAALHALRCTLLLLLTVLNCTAGSTLQYDCTVNTHSHRTPTCTHRAHRDASFVFLARVVQKNRVELQAAAGLVASTRLCAPPLHTHTQSVQKYSHTHTIRKNRYRHTQTHIPLKLHVWS